MVIGFLRKKARKKITIYKTDSWAEKQFWVVLYKKFYISGKSNFGLFYVKKILHFWQNMLNYFSLHFYIRAMSSKIAHCLCRKTKMQISLCICTMLITTIVFYCLDNIISFLFNSKIWSLLPWLKLCMPVLSPTLKKELFSCDGANVLIKICFVKSLNQTFWNNDNPKNSYFSAHIAF